ncbi:ExbD/TolR family protein [Phytohalomonas tamaricis]|uniref:ExbD/TolR family protein n=1 Tax=Phytohalomonas tamaricis TaxID=2081032 RepID=UPI000D0BC14A|nr:biopolymer transporter ExbD [Phytohalomonas tamaricis]
MKFARRRRTPVELNLTPLIDVVFLLLIFFMVSTTFDARKALELELPSASSSSAVEAAPIVIEITADGRYRLNEQPVSADTLRSALETKRDAARAHGVIIEADGHTEHQRVVTVMDIAGTLGIQHIRISTRLGDDSR